MYIRKTVRKTKDGKEYVNYLLVECVSTPKGPRQRTICSLGSLAPGPAEEWYALAKKLEAALSNQVSLVEEDDPRVREIVERVKSRKRRSGKQVNANEQHETVQVQPDAVSVEEAREAGPVHVANQFWHRLGMDEVLAEAGLDEKAIELTRVMVFNRLISPSSEHRMPTWARGTAFEDITGIKVSDLSDDVLYRNLDRLYPMHELIESKLRARELSLFNLENTVYLYDLTSTYFEGSCPKNSDARRGYSRDGRSDCKQVLVGLVVDRDGFPIMHEVFEGNRADTTTVEAMLDALEKRIGKSSGGTVVVDRGMASRENLELIRRRGYCYVVAAKQSERDAYLDEFEAEEGFTEVVRQPSPTNPYQDKTVVRVKKKEQGDGHSLLFVVSEERKAKDRAIREAQEKKFLADLGRIKERIEKGQLKDEHKVYEAIGRLKGRYSRVARYYEISYDSQNKKLEWSVREKRKQAAERLDGSYILKTNRPDLEADEIWRIYALLTRAENAFRNMKSPLAERPIFHQLADRVRAHIFLCVLAYHLLVAIEKTMQGAGIHTSWGSMREKLRTHQVVTVVFPLPDGRVLKLRRATTPEPEHVEIYNALGIPTEPMKPKKTWVKPT